ncbi:hypothetical protein K438DRAFT_2128721 [Mycena galopus ATCC 62051]|nr:hypothetical protein K438DRAFT_2128721 [Mycena galopus ATCC 62051]
MWLYHHFRHASTLRNPFWHGHHNTSQLPSPICTHSPSRCRHLGLISFHHAHHCPSISLAIPISGTPLRAFFTHAPTAFGRLTVGRDFVYIKSM